MPVNPKKRSTPAWQHHEYELDKKTGKDKAHLIRQKARAEIDKKLGKGARKGMHVAHKKALSNGGSNALSNLELETPAQNLHFKRKSNHDVKP